MSNIKRLILSNYRNHESLVLELGNRINLFVGGNARGKTNILESIYFLGRGKSFRSSHHSEMILWGKDHLKVEALVESVNGNSTAVVFSDGCKKVFRLDGKNKRGVGLGVVLFVPSDITIFAASPGERRYFLDEMLSGADAIYRERLKDYQRMLLQRNRLLKEGVISGWEKVEEELVVWTDKLIYSGTLLIIDRIYWVKKINAELPDIFTYMGGVGRDVSMEYLRNVGSPNDGSDGIMEEFRRKVEERWDIDRIRGVTHTGPHRDDWMINIFGRPISSYGTQGQMRVSAISLKMIEVEFIRKNMGEVPILLLDDVLSELDSEAAAKLIGFVRAMDGQIVMTSTDDRGTFESDPENKIFSVETLGGDRHVPVPGNILSIRSER